MLIKIIKNITCDSLSHDCSNRILSQIEKFTGEKFHASNEKEKVTGHVSISHQAGNHVIWCFFYSESGTHEQESNGNIVKTKYDKVKKYTGTIPTKTALSNAIKS